jgi:hypothetical protein
MAETGSQLAILADDADDIQTARGPVTTVDLGRLTERIGNAPRGADALARQIPSSLKPKYILFHVGAITI